MLCCAVHDLCAAPCPCRAIIVEECMRTGGIGASLSAVIHETLFNDLDHEASYSLVQSSLVSSSLIESNRV